MIVILVFSILNRLILRFDGFTQECRRDIIRTLGILGSVPILPIHFHDEHGIRIIHDRNSVRFRFRPFLERFQLRPFGYQDPILLNHESDFLQGSGRLGGDRPMLNVTHLQILQEAYTLTLPRIDRLTTMGTILDTDSRVHGNDLHRDLLLGQILVDEILCHQYLGGRINPCL